MAADSPIPARVFTVPTTFAVVLPAAFRRVERYRGSGGMFRQFDGVAKPRDGFTRRALFRRPFQHTIRMLKFSG